MDAGREEESEASRPLDVNNSTTSAAAANAVVAPSTLAPKASSHPHMPDPDNQSDAGSEDMDVSEDEDQPEPESTQSRPQPLPESLQKPLPLPMPLPHANGMPSAAAKRKLSDDMTNGSSSTVLEPPAKRQEQDKDTHESVKPLSCPRDLDAVTKFDTEAWQHVFQYLSPATLARCLRVSKTFNAYLTSTKAEVVNKKNKSNENNSKPQSEGNKNWSRLEGDKDNRFTRHRGRTLRKKDSNKIWSLSRSVFMPKMPKPLKECTDLQMLQLVGSCTCQFCKRTSQPTTAVSMAEPGPGPTGVRVIWPFRIRACGNCLQTRVITQIKLLQSPAGKLVNGLSYIMLTNTLHYMPEAVVKQSLAAMPPRPGVSINKTFYREHVDEILREYRRADDLMSGDEFIKGLLSEGKNTMADAARWENWEMQVLREAGSAHGPDLVHILRWFDQSSFPKYFAGLKRKSTATPAQPSSTMGDGKIHVLPHPPHLAHPAQAIPHILQVASHPHQPVPNGQPPASNPSHIQDRLQARKKEIERRCQELQPPLDLALLSRLKSFQAAMQIAQPMNDSAWETLKPRLLADKDTIELADHEKALQDAALGATVMPSAADDNYLKPAKEIYDKAYDQTQEPLRQRLAEYVDEHVNSVWNGNPRLDLDSSPIFAIKALAHVASRYQEDQDAGALPAPGVPKVRTKNLSKNSRALTDPFLSLDNMKWVFDNKIKPYLADAQVFICEGCVADDSETHPGWKAFEGLIQHYGAKHTDEYSRGNATVSWEEVEWPEHVPYVLQPEQWIRPQNHHRRNGHRGGGQAHANHTPRPHRNGRFAPPNEQSGHLNGQHGARANGHDIYRSYGYREYLQADNNHPPPMPVEQAPAGPSLADRANQLAADLVEVWDAFDGVSEEDMLNCIRLGIAQKHAIHRFVEKAGSPPTLDMLSDALATNPAMQHIKNAGGLACQQCVANGSTGATSYYGRVRDHKLYKTNNLVTHYKLQHAPGNGATTPLPMSLAELPEGQMVRKSAKADGITETAFQLLQEAFSEFVPHGSLEQYLSGYAAGYSSDSKRFGAASKLVERAGKRKTQEPQQGKKKKGKRASSNAKDSSQEPRPQEHEYDPRYPQASTVEEDEEAILAKYDTDVRRKKELADAAAKAPGLAHLPRDTVTALQQALGLLPTPSSTQQHAYEDRAPSVGRDSPPPSHGNVQPDIAAILASLTSGPTPSMQQVQTPSGRHSSDAAAHRSAGRPPFAPQRPEMEQYAPYAPPPPPMPAPHRYEPIGADLQAALARNAQHFGGNASLPPGYAASPAPLSRAAYAPPPPPPQQQQQQHEAPLRGWEGGEAYRRPVAVGYAPQPPPPQRRTVWVDEFGREVRVVRAEEGYPDPQPAPQPWGPPGYGGQGWGR